MPPLSLRIATWTGSLALHPGDFSPSTTLGGCEARSFTVHAGPNLNGDATLSVVVIWQLLRRLEQATATVPAHTDAQPVAGACA